MKRTAALLALALGSTMLMSAQDKSKGAEMTGTICDQKCVKQDAGKSACDNSCTEKSGVAVFVDDQGKATKIANPKMAKGKMGKKVKVHGEMMKDDSMKLYDVILANLG
ncbi:MAG TPA: hypothetical protein VFQ41_07330 [Candidatus Angelobacter sp.]|nr:hypothetical protein [Candidatus Angelobacter sp.]